MIIVKSDEIAKERFTILTHIKLLIVSMIATMIAMGVHVAASIINLGIILFSMTANLISIPNQVTTRAYKTEAFNQIVKRRIEQNANV